MKIRKAAVLCLLGLVVAGCRNDPNISLLERDNNQKEMEIYHLKCRVADLEEQLSSTPSGPGVVTGPAAVLPGAGPAMTRPGASDEAAPAFSAPAKTEPSVPSGPSFEPLNISPGVETPSGQVPNTLKSEPGHRIPPPGGTQWKPHAETIALASGTVDLDSRSVMQITLHPSLTGGIGSGPSGDNGLLVVVEPRDQAGNIVPVGGATSVALIDPAVRGEEARMGRWDFTAAQTERMLHIGSEPGIHFRLPWRSVPLHDRMEVFVRYTTADGRTLEARRQIAVALGGAEPERREPPPPIDGERPDNRPKRPVWSPER